MSMVKPRSMPSVRPAFVPTHEIEVGNSPFIRVTPVMRSRNAWWDGHASYYDMDDFPATKLRKAKRSAPTPRHRRAAGPRNVLRQVSDTKRDWQALYRPWLAFLIAIDPICRRCRYVNPVTPNIATEGHHPFGQIGALILAVLPFCRSCHEEVENNKKQARKDGWIRY